MYMELKLNTSGLTDAVFFGEQWVHLWILALIDERSAFYL